MKNIPVLSFFSGAGFLDLGFKYSGFDVVFTNEISYQIGRVYESGMSSCLGEKTIITSEESIEKLTASYIKGLVKRQNIDDFWGIIGGPPCPDFSIGGKNRGHEGDKGRLTEIFVNLICESEPYFFVIENVKGLFKTKKHREFFDSMVAKLEKCGYAIDYKLLNALELGIPQDRERIFIIGVCSEIYESYFLKDYDEDKEWFYWPIYGKYTDAKSKYDWPIMNEFGKDINIPLNIPKELMVDSYMIKEADFEKVANSREYFNPKSDKFKTIFEGDIKRKSFKRLHRYRYSPTVAYGNNEVHLHPSLPRRLSVREALRLQTVPDNYVIAKDISLTTKFKAIGNGVPVKMANIIASNLHCFLNQYMINRGERNEFIRDGN